MKPFTLAMIVLTTAVLAGCATGGLPVDDSRVVPAQAYYKEGQALEQNGQLVEAARMYRLALTLTPRDSTIAQALERNETERERMAEARFQQGERDYAIGKFKESKIAYLAALRLWPAHAGALERLKSREKITATHQGKHIVQKGETLAIIAKKYYGDYRQYQMLAQYNKLSDATQIEIGQEIMIPEMGAGSIPATESGDDVESNARLAVAAEETITETVAIQVTNYRDDGRSMLQDGDYASAIVELRKVLNVVPDDQEVRVDLSKAHNAYARQLWDRQEIDKAREQFDACLEFKDDCPSCRPIVDDCENAYKERLYNRGIAFFQDEKPEAALAEWEIVQTIDPGYRNVADYIQKARKISEQLGKLKQGQRAP